MDELRNLYQELIVDHNRKPRNYRVMEHPSHLARGNNPLCGDKVVVFLHVEGGKILDISFQGEGCAISTASASLMTQQLKGKTVAEAETLFREFHSAVTSDAGSTRDAAETTERLGKLAVLTGVRSFPSRVKCATLPWHTMQGAPPCPGIPCRVRCTTIHKN